jgi:hypothetical protein
MAALFIGEKASPGSAIRPELNGALFCGFIAAALFAAISGRKLSPFLHLWLLGLVSVATSAALTFWGAPSEVAGVIGATLACATIFVPVSLLLIHWRHVVSDFVFYGMIALHALGFVYDKAN